MCINDTINKAGHRFNGRVPNKKVAVRGWVADYFHEKVSICQSIPAKYHSFF